MAQRAKSKKAGQIRVGVFGIGRGRSFAAQAAAMEGVELVALCDQREKALSAFAAQYPQVTTYTDFDRMLEHDLDAVVLANFATEHVPAAIKALARGLHVQSENIPVKTMAEAVALVRAVEDSGKIYMYAENYCYSNYVQEMRHIYQQGEIGEFNYADGEYVHPISPDGRLSLTPAPDHWRAWLPATYYCTHSLGPVMYVTRRKPVTVNGFVIPYDPAMDGGTWRKTDVASVIICGMDNGGFVKLLQGGLRKHCYWTRIYCQHGNMENMRIGDTQMLAVHKEEWERRPDEPADLIYKPVFRKHHQEASRSGHGGGDFFMLREFCEAIRTGRQPYLDVYTGLQMGCVGILAYRSALNRHETIDVPDFRRKKDRETYENDHWSPDPADAGPGQPFPSITGEVKHTPAQIRSLKNRVKKLRPDLD